MTNQKFRNSGQATESYVFSKLQVNSESKASKTQNTENPQAHDNNLTKICGLKQKKPNRLFVGNLNINSICSKNDKMKCLLNGKVDVFYYYLE